MSLVEADLSTVTSMSDKILRIAEKNPWLPHLEWQSWRDSQLMWWLGQYSILIERRFELPVWTTVVMLTPEAADALLTGTLYRTMPDGRCYDQFS